MRNALPKTMPEEGVKWDEIHPDIERVIMVQYFLKNHSINVASQESHTGNTQNSSLGFLAMHRILESSENSIRPCLIVRHLIGFVLLLSRNVRPVATSIQLIG